MPRPVIWLKMVALICNLGCCLARLLWLSTRPKPDSIIQTYALLSFTSSSPIIAAALEWHWEEVLISTIGVNRRTLFRLGTICPLPG